MDGAQRDECLNADYFLILDDTQEMRMNEHIAHVTTGKSEAGYEVEYSIAKWYFEECARAGIKV